MTSLVWTLKWSQIKRQKGVNDSKRGQLFTKLGREITIAARDGGGDPNANFRLRLALQRARESNMPMDNIDRAIKRGTGGGEGAALEEITYEGYGAGGAAVMVEAMTDNRNRAASDIRGAFTRGGGSLGETGCVAWLFDTRGVITLDIGDADPDELSLAAIDAGAEDVQVEDGALEVYTQPSDMEAVRQALETSKLNITGRRGDHGPQDRGWICSPKDAVAGDEAARAAGGVGRRSDGCTPTLRSPKKRWRSTKQLVIANRRVVLGIDPGTAIMGYGAVAVDGYCLTVVDYGVLTTPSNLPLTSRLLMLFDGLNEVFERISPRRSASSSSSLPATSSPPLPWGRPGASPCWRPPGTACP